MNNNRKITLVRPSQMFDTFMDEYFNAGNISTVLGNLEVDMFETDSDVMVEAKVAGFKEDEVNLKVEDNILIIEASNSEESEEQSNRKYHLKEMRRQSFSRSISLPTKVDAEKAEATFENGIIKIKLPKLTEVRPKTITIKTSKK